jgi:hypothetical protein
LNAVGTISIKDITNNMGSVISFDAQKKERTGYWTSWVIGADKVNKDSGVLDNRRDLINITISQNSGSAKPKVLAEGFGSYLEDVSFDEKKAPLWTINDTHRATEWSNPDVKYRLESDCQMRLDR